MPKPYLSASVRLRILLWLMLLIGGAVLGLWIDVQWFPAWLTSPRFHLLSLAAGLLLLTAVMIVPRNTGRTLAMHGRKGELPRMETNRLVTTGPYSCMRHPMHFSASCSFP